MRMLLLAYLRHKALKMEITHQLKRFHLNHNVYITICLILMIADQAVRCKSLDEQSQQFTTNKRLNREPDRDNWTPLRDYKSPTSGSQQILDNLKLMKPSDLESYRFNPASDKSQQQQQPLLLQQQQQSQDLDHNINQQQQAPLLQLAKDSTGSNVQHQQVDLSHSGTVVAAVTPPLTSCAQVQQQLAKMGYHNHESLQPEAAASVLNAISAPNHQNHAPMDDGGEGESYEDESDDDENTGGGGNPTSRSAGIGSTPLNDYYTPGFGVSAATTSRSNRSMVRNNQQPQVEPVDNDIESAERREQEAAEASEAEAADRSALDEQQQQQRAIIMAQAQSEAKAIKEQQEALLKQQRLQQQMLLRRQQYDLDANQSASHLMRSSLVDRQKLQHQTSVRQQQQKPANQVDIQFSDQPDSTVLNLVRDNRDVDAEIASGQSYQLQAINSLTLANENALINQVELPNAKSSSDLVSAAQHHYGSHYDTLHGHHKDYYQFAESHKKGQYDSGFKRGGKKFQISGHSSQHKSHAEGHVKWHGKKGKGVQYWDYKHKNKKHHGYH